MHIRILKAKAAAKGLSLWDFLSGNPRKPQNPKAYKPYVAVCEDEHGCLHIKPRVHARRTIGRVIYWTGNGRASSLGDVT